MSGDDEMHKTREGYLHPSAAPEEKRRYRSVLCLWESACVRFVPLL
jgi:hypothetical protein